MEMLRLDPPILVDVKDRGKGEASVFINYGMDFEPAWIVFMDSTGESLLVANSALKKDL